ncbi:MAG: hypothetical protein Q8L48_42530 [Archangium sp.]|nr:hypothetical protein [Archangium sp.]
MPRRTREAPQSAAKRLSKQLPKLSPLLREGFKSMWTDKQCDAWARRTKANDVLHQAHDWLTVAAGALAREDHQDVPYSKQRLAWLAELTVRLEEEIAGTPKPEVVAARLARDAALDESKQVRARLHSRMVLLVGGDEERGAALAIANKGSRTPAEVTAALTHLRELLIRWRRDARLRVLADELGLDESLLVRAEESARLLRDSELHPAAEGESPSVSRTEGRVLRELRALQLAFAAAREEKLDVPALKVRPAMKSILSARLEGDVAE